ncbi:hypothetical protein [Pedobacter metabolipauper]|nr:hypothetical protein [Pedobacter metabolipauper]
MNNISLEEVAQRIETIKAAGMDIFKNIDPPVLKLKTSFPDFIAGTGLSQKDQDLVKGVYFDWLSQQG